MTAASSYVDRALSVPAAIEARRSVRRYTDDPVPDADVERIVELAGRAPSAFNVQPWRFVAVRDPATRAALQAAAFGQAQVAAAPVVFVVYSDMADMLEHAEDIVHPGVPPAQREATISRVRQAFGADPERERWGAGQSYIAVGFLLLAAQSLGYATSAMLGFDPAKVKEALGLPDHVAVPALVAMGVGAEDGFPTFRLPVDRILRRA